MLHTVTADRMTFKLQANCQHVQQGQSATHSRREVLCTCAVEKPFPHGVHGLKLGRAFARSLGGMPAASSMLAVFAE